MHIVLKFLFALFILRISKSSEYFVYKKRRLLIENVRMWLTVGCEAIPELIKPLNLNKFTGCYVKRRVIIPHFAFERFRQCQVHAVSLSDGPVKSSKRGRLHMPRSHERHDVERPAGLHEYRGTVARLLNKVVQEPLVLNRTLLTVVQLHS